MAQVSDSIAATVTVRADGAIKDLSTLSRKAKETGASFNDASRQTTAASTRMATSTNRTAASATKATGAFGQFRTSVSGASSAMGAFGVAAGVIGTATAGIFSAVNAASRLNEQISGSKVTFGAASAQVQAFSRTTATGLGIAASEALRASNQLGAFFKQAGFAQAASAKMSTTLVQLAGDLASFRDVGVDQALAAISSGLAGESEPLRRLGVDLRITKVDAEALASGFAATKDAITETDRVAARYVSLLRQTTDAQTDAARTAGEYANTQRRFNATLEDFRANAGQGVLPFLTDLTQGLSLLTAAATRGGAPLKEAGVGIGDFFKAVGKGAAVGLATGGVGATPAFLASIGDAGSETGDKLQAAAKVYTDAIGRFGDESPEAANAIAKLRAEVDAAEKAAVKSGQAFESTARHTARLRDEATAAAGAIRGFIDAQRAGEDATLRVADSRRTLGDAERSLNELRAKGAVDAEKVADAEQAVADAAQGAIDARERQSDAEKRLAELRARGAVDMKKVWDAEWTLAQRSDATAAARRSLADAEKELARLRAGPTADESGDAGRDVTRAELDLERAKRQLADARKANQIAQRQGGRTAVEAALDLREAELALADALDSLSGAQKAQMDLNNRGLPGSEALTDAEQRAADARAAVADATRSEREQEQELRDARAGDPDYAINIAKLERDVAGAKRSVEAATRGEKEAGDELRDARAGDPDFAHRLADAERAVESALRGVERAEQDLPIAAEAAKIATDNFTASLQDGSDAADTLQGKLNLLDAKYRAMAGIPNLKGIIGGDIGSVLTPTAPISADFGGASIPRRAAGGPVSAGRAYLVGEKRAEIFEPRVSGYIHPSTASASGSTGAPTVNMHLVAPHETGIVSQVEYAGRVVGWRLGRSGRA